jgi:hypothetical protein
MDFPREWYPNNKSTETELVIYCDDKTKKGKTRLLHIIKSKIVVGADCAVTIRGVKINPTTKKEEGQVVLYWGARAIPRPINYDLLTMEEQYSVSSKQLAKSAKAETLQKNKGSTNIVWADVLNPDNYAPGFYRRS